MGVLENLAMGLRQAGGVLNPAVQGILANESSQDEAYKRQVGMLQLQKQMEMQSPEYQMRLEQLNNERGFRQAATQAGGDMTKLSQAAIQYGKPEIAMKIYEGAENRQARLQQARDAMEGRMAELQMKLDDRAASREQQAQYQQQMIMLRQQGQALQAQIAQGNQHLRGLGLQLQQQGLDLQRAKLDEGKTKELEKKVQGLGTALEKANLPEADSVLSAVETKLSQKPELAEYISGPKSILPDMTVPDDAKSLRQSFQKLFNITLKDRSGAAVTNQELQRLQKEFATGAFKDAKQLQDAVSQARGIIDNHYRSVASSFGPDALKAYNENLGKLGGRSVVTPPPNGGAKPTGSVLDAADAILKGQK